VDQKERKYSTFSYLDDSRENSLTKINEINDTLNKLQPIISVGRFSKNFENFENFFLIFLEIVVSKFRKIGILKIFENFWKLKSV
jgi:hypothetical protein